MFNLAVRQCRECDAEGFSNTLTALLGLKSEAAQKGRTWLKSSSRGSEQDLETMGLLLQSRWWERLLMAVVEGAHLVSERAACSVLDHLRPLILALPFRQDSWAEPRPLRSERCAGLDSASGEEDSYPHATAADMWVEQVCDTRDHADLISVCDTRGTDRLNSNLLQSS